LAYSSDGITWTASTSGNGVFTDECRAVAWNGTLWVAGGSGTNQLAYSSDGITWTVSTSGSSLLGEGACYAIAWNGSRWVAGGFGTGGFGANQILYSSDGITWTASTSGNAVLTNLCNAVAWNGTRWVAGGNGNNRLAYSSDGITWTASTSGNAVLENCIDLEWNGTIWVAGGDGANKLVYSSDGITWTVSTSGNAVFTTQCGAVASRRVLPYVGTTPATAARFVGPTGSILFSPNGTDPTGSTGLTYKEGPTGLVMTLKGDLIPSEHDVYSLGSTGTRWQDIYVSTGSIHIGNATLSATGTALIFNGDLIPSTTNTFSVGNVDNLLKSMHIGPGTVFIGPTGTIGNDDNGIIYSQFGFAAPTLALGASIPGATGLVEGGVRLTLTGGTGPIQYQHIGTGGVVNGPVYTLLTSDTQNTGPTGYTGPVGANGISSGLVIFLDSAGGTAPQTGTASTTPNITTQVTIFSGNQSTSATPVLMGTFVSDPSIAFLSTVIIGGYWDFNIYFTNATTANVKFYGDVYYVDADGSSNPVLIATGTNETAVSVTQSLQGVYIYSLLVPTTTLPDLTKRIRMRVYCVFSGNGNNQQAYIELRNGTVSHVHTTLLANLEGPTGPTGPAAADSAAWTTYTPTWTASTTNPSLGNGALTGRYKAIGKTVFLQIQFEAGSSTTFGSGHWKFSLPVAAYSGSSAVLSATFLDNGTQWYAALATSEYDNNTAYVVPITTASGPVGPTIPFTWTSTDKMTICGSYESA
jgi:hypothetical protein